MNGTILKHKLLEIDSSLAQVARKLNVSQQALNQTLKAADIKTGFLENIAKIYDRPISFFFEEQNDMKVSVQACQGSAASFLGDASARLNNVGFDELKREVDRLNEEIVYYRARLEEKEHLIKILLEKL